MWGPTHWSSSSWEGAGYQVGAEHPREEDSAAWQVVLRMGEREVDQGQSSLHNFILSHCQSILATLKLSFLFFIISWTYMGVMAFNALDSACCKLNTNLMKE